METCMEKKKKKAVKILWYLWKLFFDKKKVKMKTIIWVGKISRKRLTEMNGAKSGFLLHINTEASYRSTCKFAVWVPAGSR